MSGSTLERSLMNAKSVASVLDIQGASGIIKGSTLEKSLMNVNSVASLLAEKKT